MLPHPSGHLAIPTMRLLTPMALRLKKDHCSQRVEIRERKPMISMFESRLPISRPFKGSRRRFTWSAASSMRMELVPATELRCACFTILTSTPSSEILPTRFPRGLTSPTFGATAELETILKHRKTANTSQTDTAALSRRPHDCSPRACVSSILLSLYDSLAA